MTTHITVRLAWHNDGWNGRICEKPAENTYCVGCHSYPGEMIREQRDIAWEKEHAGELIAELDQQPPCMYSASAFADSGSEMFAEPPDFFNDDTKMARWSILPATACTWPYEAMYYKPDLKLSNGPQNNLELGYAISVHKSQGSEFDRVYFVLPKVSPNRQMMELLYTGLTRASTHCTVFIQDNVETLLSHMRPERSALTTINTSLFSFRAVPVELLRRDSWYEEGKVHKALTGDMVRSKSEVIIANMLHQKDIPFEYERPLYADDSTMYLPDFTINWKGETYYWEHLGMLDDESYAQKWNKKEQWYKDYGFHQQLIVSKDEKGNLDSQEIERIINRRIFGIDEMEQRKSWDEIAELASSDLINDFVVAAKQKGLALPVWGYEIVIKDEIRGCVEFAWPEKKVVITTDNDESESIELLEQTDWVLFSIDQFPAKKLVNVINALIS